jgi:hypothetical protein
MPLTQEQFEQLPDYAKPDYTQHEDSYIPVAELKSGKLKASLDNLDAKFKASEQQKAQEIEAARSKALEEARSKGDVARIEKEYEERMLDLEKKTAERVRAEVEQELTAKQATQQAAALADKIGLTLGIDSEDGETIADLIRHRVKIEPSTGKEIYYGADGSALSVDRAGFEAELKKEARFKRLIKADVTTRGGGMAQGSTGHGGSAPDTNAKAEAAKKNGDLRGYLNAAFNNN